MTNLRRSPGEWVSAGPAFVRTLAAVPNDARVFVPFAVAGAAIWYGFPRGVRVFADSRNDCYSAETLSIFLLLESDAASPSTYRDALGTTGTDTAVVPRSHPLSRFLGSESGWRLAREDGDWRLFLLTR